MRKYKFVPRKPVKFKELIVDIKGKTWEITKTADFTPQKINEFVPPAVTLKVDGETVTRTVLPDPTDENSAAPSDKVKQASFGQGNGVSQEGMTSEPASIEAATPEPETKGTDAAPSVSTTDVSSSWQNLLYDDRFLQARAQAKTGGDPELLIGKRKIKATPLAMREIHEEMAAVIVEGDVVSAEVRELRTGRKLLKLKMADDTNGLAAQYFFEKGEDTSCLEKNLCRGKRVRARGEVRQDKYSGGLVMQLSNLMLVPTGTYSHEDNHPTPRVELHLHTKMSTDALIDVDRLLTTVKEWNHPAVAITDHGVVQSFPIVQALAAEKGVKVIYGMEGYLIEDIPADITRDQQKYTHIILLAKNRVGLQNLYRLVSLSHLRYFKKRPLIPRAILDENREGLIVGSACVAGELFRAVLDDLPRSEQLRIASYYDYLEIQPIGDNRFLLQDDRYPNIKTDRDLQKLNEVIVSLGEELNLPVCATCDSHYLFDEDKIYREILLSKWGKSGEPEQLPDLYLRTTEEMLEEFSYLGETKAFEVVVSNTRGVSELVEDFAPLPADGKLYSPQISGSDTELEHMCYAKAKRLYGDPLPAIVEERLKSELEAIIGNGFGVLYYIAHKLVAHSLGDGYLVGSRGSVGSSFVATMADITEVNPLPPHYLCPQCQYSEFVTDGSVGGGFDLADKACPKCGSALHKDGHNIPFAVFLGFEGDKVPDIDLNFSGDYQPQAHKYTEELFGRDNVFRAGTISGIQDRTAFGYVKKYAEQRQLVTNDIYAESLLTGITKVKNTTGQHPGGIMVCPRDMDILAFTPIQHPANKKESGIITTHFDYHSIEGRMVKLDILGHDDPTVIRILEDLTGIKPSEIPFDDPATISLFSSTEALGLTPEQLNGDTVGTLGIPEYGTQFVRQMLEDTHPQNFSELVRISGFSHGTDVWLNNAKDLITAGEVKLEDAISTRDDVMNYLIQHGVAPKIAFNVMENVRKGRGLEKKNKQGQPVSKNEEALRKEKIPEWFINSCKKISYLFPRAHAVAYVMMAFRIAWFKIYHPLAFYAAYFTVRARGSFDGKAILPGLASQEKMWKYIQAKGRDASAVEKDSATNIEVAMEMAQRGFRFKSIDLARSHVRDFVVEDGMLLPPLSCVPGLGETVAEEIVAARENGPFTSKEDLRKRGKVSQTIVETLTEMGALEGMPDEEQLNLFG